MNKQLIKFHLYLFVVLGVSYFIHNYIVSFNQLFLLYALNLVIAIFVYWLVFLLRNKQKEYLGFYFLAGTLIKFIVFFVIVLPIFKEDNIVSKTEFLSFFTPYLLSLLVETKYLISLLNSIENKLS
tara:strand:- start:397 stop:774 length:378 start_codon:yes stop_codon:yes gene_type:complete